MATNAARRLLPMAGNTAAIVAIELLAAAQGVEMRTPLTTSPKLGDALAQVRASAAFWDRDRAFAPDLGRRARRASRRATFLPFAGRAVRAIAVDFARRRAPMHRDDPQSLAVPQPGTRYADRVDPRAARHRAHARRAGSPRRRCGC